MEPHSTRRLSSRRREARWAAAVAAAGLAATGALVAAPVAHGSPTSPTITRYAGTGIPTAPTNGLAVQSALSAPQGVAVDGVGNVYIADCGSTVEKVTPAGQLTIIAGNGTAAPAVPGPALSSPLPCASGVAVDAAGNVFISDYADHEILKVTPAGVLSVYAGNGTYGSAPVEGPALQTSIGEMQGLAVDAAGNLYVGDYEATGRVYKITPAGQLVFVAGNGSAGTPVPGPALQSPLGTNGGAPIAVAVDKSGNVYVADQTHNVVEKVTPGGTLSIFAGMLGHGEAPTPGPATSSAIGTPNGLAVGPDGDLYIADPGHDNILKVTPSGTLSILAGTGTGAAPTYGGPASASALDNPLGVAVNAAGTVFIADLSNFTVDRVGAATPSAPLGLRATAGDGSATLTFIPPADPGLSPVTGYEVSVDGGHTWHALAVSGTSPLTAHLTGLTNGTRYPVEIRAVNSTGGPGPASTSANVTPRSGLAAAGATRGVHARALPAALEVTWQAPINAGTPALTGYLVTVTDRTTGAIRVLHVGRVSGTTVTGLTPGDQYTVTVAATNPAGTGPASPPATARLPLPALAVTPAQRRQEIAVPANPRTYRGPLRHTRTDGRSHNGTPAFAATGLHGYQLRAHQAVALDGSSIFAYNSARLSTHGRAVIKALVVDLGHTKTLTCEGYTDYQVDPAHAKTLSTQRATAVCRALKADGAHVTTTAVGYSGQRPVIVGGTIHQRGPNRRVVLYITA